MNTNKFLETLGYFMSAWADYDTYLFYTYTNAVNGKKIKVTHMAENGSVTLERV